MCFMGFLGFGKKRDIVDLTEHYKRQQEKLARQQGQTENSITKTGSGEGFSVFDNLDNQAPSSATSEDVDFGAGEGSIEERRKRLAKRLMEMTTKIEELSNQIYHLQQRVELLEKKTSIR